MFRSQHTQKGMTYGSSAYSLGSAERVDPLEMAAWPLAWVSGISIGNAHILAGGPDPKVIGDTVTSDDPYQRTRMNVTTLFSAPVLGSFPAGISVRVSDLPVVINDLLQFLLLHKEWCSCPMESAPKYEKARPAHVPVQ